MIYEIVSADEGLATDEFVYRVRYWYDEEAAPGKSGEVPPRQPDYIEDQIIAGVPEYHPQPKLSLLRQYLDLEGNEVARFGMIGGTFREILPEELDVEIQWEQPTQEEIDRLILDPIETGADIAKRENKKGDGTIPSHTRNSFRRINAGRKHGLLQPQKFRGRVGRI